MPIGLIGRLIVPILMAASFTNVAFLWHNVIGAVAVVIIGLIVSAVDPADRKAAA